MKHITFLYHLRRTELTDDSEKYRFATMFWAEGIIIIVLGILIKTYITYALESIPKFRISNKKAS